jgi:hypothetical protein
MNVEDTNNQVPIQDAESKPTAQLFDQNAVISLLDIIASEEPSKKFGGVRVANGVLNVRGELSGNVVIGDNVVSKKKSSGVYLEIPVQKISKPPFNPIRLYEPKKAEHQLCPPGSTYTEEDGLKLKNGRDGYPWVVVDGSVQQYVVKSPKELPSAYFIHGDVEELVVDGSYAVIIVYGKITNVQLSETSNHIGLVSYDGISLLKGVHANHIHAYLGSNSSLTAHFKKDAANLNISWFTPTHQPQTS